MVKPFSRRLRLQFDSSVETLLPPLLFQPNLLALSLELLLSLLRRHLVTENFPRLELVVTNSVGANELDAVENRRSVSEATIALFADGAITPLKRNDDLHLLCKLSVRGLVRAVSWLPLFARGGTSAKGGSSSCIAQLSVPLAFRTFFEHAMDLLLSHIVSN